MQCCYAGEDTFGADNREVDSAQKALAEARLRARGLHGKAEQEQADARRLADQAHSQGAQAQAEAGKSQLKESQAHEQQLEQNHKTWNSQQTVDGQVLETKGNGLKIRTAGRQDVSLDLNDSTAISIDGKMGTASQVQPGSDVRASYQLVDGRAKALKLEVRSNEGPSSQDRQSAQPAQDSSSTQPAKDSSSAMPADSSTPPAAGPPAEPAPSSDKPSTDKPSSDSHQ